MRRGDGAALVVEAALVDGPFQASVPGFPAGPPAGEALDLQLKYAVTRYLHVDNIGSGLNETPGNRRRVLRAQLRWHF